jgi:hypothetical protein
MDGAPCPATCAVKAGTAARTHLPAIADAACRQDGHGRPAVARARRRNGIHNLRQQAQRGRVAAARAVPARLAALHAQGRPSWPKLMRLQQRLKASAVLAGTAHRIADVGSFEGG